jgi:hypothetical protein
MTQKERLLAINNYEEYLKQRESFKGLKPDKEVVAHLSKIFPKVSDTKEELYKTPPQAGKKRSIGR